MNNMSNQSQYGTKTECTCNYRHASYEPCVGAVKITAWDDVKVTNDRTR